jgi:hypothetical protein
MDNLQLSLESLPADEIYQIYNNLPNKDQISFISASKTIYCKTGKNTPLWKVWEVDDAARNRFQRELILGNACPMAVIRKYTEMATLCGTVIVCTVPSIPLRSTIALGFSNKLGEKLIQTFIVNTKIKNFALVTLPLATTVMLVDITPTIGIVAGFCLAGATQQAVNINFDMLRAKLYDKIGRVCVIAPQLSIIAASLGLSLYTDSPFLFGCANAMTGALISEHVIGYAGAYFMATANPTFHNVAVYANAGIQTANEIASWGWNLGIPKLINKITHPFG